MKTKSANSRTNGNGSTASRSDGTKSTATKNSRKPAEKEESGGNSETASGLRELFVDMLKDIYWVEKTLTKAIPKLVKKATSEELIGALQDHLAVTEEHVKRVEQVFEAMGKKPQAKKCEAMEGLLKEAEEVMEETEEGVVRDAGIIVCAQKVEHYEIASYGSLCAFAKTLGEDEVASMLEETLEEEKEADQTLTTVAESTVNIEAAEEDEEEEDEEGGVQSKTSMKQKASDRR